MKTTIPPHLLLACVVVLAGCQLRKAPAPALAPLAPEIVQAAARPATLQLRIRPATAAKRYKLAAVQQLDWDSATARLTSTRAGFVPRVVTAAVDVSDDNIRTADLTMAGLTPGSGYGLELTLSRGGVVIADGEEADFALAAGGNAANVTLTLTAAGAFQVTIQEPTLSVPVTTLPVEIATGSHFGVRRFAGGDVTGNVVGSGDPFGDRFGTVRSIAQDATTGDLLVTDTVNHQIRRVSATTGSTLIAGDAGGTGTAGDYSDAGDGGAATDALLKTPHGLVLAADGSIVFCDGGNNRLRVVRANGTIDTLAGGGADATSTSYANAQDAQLDTPWALAAGANDELYFTDKRGGRSIWRIDTDGSMTQVIAIAGTEFFHSLAIDRANDMLWASVTNSSAAIVSNLSGTPSVADVTFAPASPNIRALAYDQTGTAGRLGTLFYTTNDFKLWRVPVGADGQAGGGRAPEVIAGTGVAGSVPTTQQEYATDHPFAGAPTSLYVDVRNAGGAGSSGILFAGSNNTYGQIMVLDPSTW